MCLILSDYRDTAVWVRKYESTVNSNKEREITGSLFDFFHTIGIQNVV
jgi:hypothetical protein